MRAMLLAITLLAISLAGCSDDPITGEFSSTGSSIMLDAEFNVTYQAFNNPYAQTSGTELECQQDSVPAPVGDQIDDCTYPYTKVGGHVMQLPEPDNSGYAVYFVDSSFTRQPMELDSLSSHTMADWMFDNEGDCDGQFTDEGCNLEGLYDTVEVRLVSSGLPVATAPASAGSQTFSVHEGLLGVSFDASYTDNELTLTVSGMGNFTATGWLVTMDEETGEKTHVEQFPVAGNGEVTYEAEDSIDSYAEVHLHVTGTKINVAVGAIA